MTPRRAIDVCLTAIIGTPSAISAPQHQPAEEIPAIVSRQHHESLELNNSSSRYGSMPEKASRSCDIRCWPQLCVLALVSPPESCMLMVGIVLEEERAIARCAKQT